MMTLVIVSASLVTRSVTSVLPNETLGTRIKISPLVEMTNGLGTSAFLH